MRELVSIRRRRKILPAGMTLAANESFPIRDRREHFVHRVHLEKARSSCRSDDSLSRGSERDWATVSICTPKKVMTVDGGDRFSTLVITPRESQRASMLLKVERQAAPAT